MTENKPLPPWVPEGLKPPGPSREMSDRDYAESVLDSLIAQYHPQVTFIDPDDLAEAVTRLDHLGHSDSATRLVDAAHELDVALRNALDVLKLGGSEVTA